MSNDAADAMRARLRTDLKTAMQARSALEVGVLRSLIAAIDNAQAVPTAYGHQNYVSRAFGDGTAEVPRVTLSQADLGALLAMESEARIGAADELDRCGRPVEAAALREQALIARRYME